MNAADEAPRDRLLRAGARSLTDAELLSVLVCGGRRPVAVDRAREVLAAAGGLSGLTATDPARLRWLPAPQRAAVLAASELACRVAGLQVPQSEPLNSPEKVAAYLRLRYARRDQEVLGALYLDVRNRLIGEGEIVRGGLTGARVTPRSVLVEALVRSAAGLILFHNHPSADPTPSAGDLVFTSNLRKAGDLLGVTVQDHFVLSSSGRWESMRSLASW